MRLPGLILLSSLTLVAAPQAAEAGIGTLLSKIAKAGAKTGAKAGTKAGAVKAGKAAGAAGVAGAAADDVAKAAGKATRGADDLGAAAAAHGDDLGAVGAHADDLAKADEGGRLGDVAETTADVASNFTGDEEDGGDNSSCTCTERGQDSSWLLLGVLVVPFLRRRS